MRANSHRDLWPLPVPQDLEPVATRDDVGNLVRLDGNSFVPSAVEQMLEITEEHEACAVGALI